MNQYRLLIVDDYPSLLYPLEIFFERQGYAVSLAYDGLQAVSKAESADAILMDTQMPGMTGIEACKQMRALPRGKHPVIIGMSSDEELFDRKGHSTPYRDLWVAAGADDFVPKTAMSSSSGLSQVDAMIHAYFSARNSRA